MMNQEKAEKRDYIQLNKLNLFKQIVNVVDCC